MRGKPVLPAVSVVMVIVIFALPFFSVPEYEIQRHTTSELGAQGAPHAWIMNTVFALLGVASVVDGWPRLTGLWFHRLALSIFGAALVLVATFQHAPVPADVAFSAREDELHSLFSGIAGVSFIALAIASGFAGVEGRDRWLGPAVGAFAALMSRLIFAIPDAAGVWQRLLFCTTFGWLILFFAKRGNRDAQPRRRKRADRDGR